MKLSFNIKESSLLEKYIYFSLDKSQIHKTHESRLSTFEGTIEKIISDPEATQLTPQLEDFPPHLAKFYTAFTASQMHHSRQDSRDEFIFCHSKNYIFFNIPLWMIITIHTPQKIIKLERKGKPSSWAFHKIEENSSIQLHLFQENLQELPTHNEGAYLMNREIHLYESRKTGKTLLSI